MRDKYRRKLIMMSITFAIIAAITSVCAYHCAIGGSKTWATIFSISAIVSGYLTGFYHSETR